MLLDAFTPDQLEAGCDEAGRGCLAGPVVAAAVILPRGIILDGLNDSKQLSEAKREELAPIIMERALAWAVAEVDHAEIDRINILKASWKAMNLSVSALPRKPDLLLIDGNRFGGNPDGIPHKCIVKGDGKYLSIAAASVLAKVHRDKLMLRLAEEYPAYQWEKNKGYPTPEHKEAVFAHGVSKYHRRTFLRKMAQMGLDF